MTVRCVTRWSSDYVPSQRRKPLNNLRSSDVIQVVAEPNGTLVPLDSFLSALFVRTGEGLSFLVRVVHHTCSAQLCRFHSVKTCAPGFRVFIAQGKLGTIPNTVYAK